MGLKNTGKKGSEVRDRIQYTLSDKVLLVCGMDRFGIAELLKPRIGHLWNLIFALGIKIPINNLKLYIP